MKKILFVINQLNIGGAEQSLINLFNVIDYNEYKIDLLVFDQQKNDSSLVKHVNKNVRTCVTYKKHSLYEKIVCRLKTPPHLGHYSRKAINFLKGKKYDWAFSVGEWIDHDLVATACTAKHKAIWIHNDLNLKSFNMENFFNYYDFYEKMIFVSKKSMEESIHNFPFIKEKSIVIQNIIDTNKIIKLSQENDSEYKTDKLTLLTIANFRPEKNHLRQIEVMRILKDRGIKFRWINIGRQDDKRLMSLIKSKIKENDLENDFIIRNYSTNPYKYMRQVDALTVLSDYESWSMVITEAKVLGIPIIATKTSGALEQLEDNINGILCDFDANSIANKIENFIKNQKLRDTITKNLQAFKNSHAEQILIKFNDLINSHNTTAKKDIIYLMDIINYKGGAHVATINQIHQLKKRKNISILSYEVPNLVTRNKLIGVRFYSYYSSPVFALQERRILDVVLDLRTPIKYKILKIKMYVYTKIHGHVAAFKKYILKTYSEFLSQFKIGCVTSEGSEFKDVLGCSNVKKKIQWIHTDYCNLLDANMSSTVHSTYKQDVKTWEKYDTIVLLSNSIQRRFNERFPSLSKKTIVLENLIDCDTIIKKSLITNVDAIKFITVARLEEEKNFVSIIKAFNKIKKLGYKFSYLIIGSGALSGVLNDLILSLNMSNEIKILNFVDNPFCYIKKADIFLLCSLLEGLPNVIYESMILHTPVLATKVGGIEDQIKDKYNGWLVTNPNEEEIFKVIKFVIENKETISICRKNLENYTYNNNKIIKTVETLFDTEDIN